MATTTKYSVGMKFALPSGSTATKTFSGISQAEFTSEDVDDLVAAYPKIVAGTAKTYTKTTDVVTDYE